MEEMEEILEEILAEMAEAAPLELHPLISLKTLTKLIKSLPLAFLSLKALLKVIKRPKKQKPYKMTQRKNPAETLPENVNKNQNL
jgi:hypothetical protein